MEPVSSDREDMTLLPWDYFPKSDSPPEIVRRVVREFEAVHAQMDSRTQNLNSNDVMGAVRPGLERLGFRVERGKSRTGKIPMPVLFGPNGVVLKTFDVDAYHAQERLILEVEAGRAVVNHQFLKDLFEACMMRDVDYLAIAVRQTYKRRGDFKSIVRFFETLYASQRIRLPLKGIAIVGY